MVTVSMSTDNCDAARAYTVEALAGASVELRFEFDTIVSGQSPNPTRLALCAAIRDQLSPFEWICTGPVNLELLWYLDGTQRQETDKVGDIDNITKPIIDALAGPQGLLVDDGLVAALYTRWNARNPQAPRDALHIRLEFNTDHCLPKKNLVFVRYAGAACLAMTVDFSDTGSMLSGLALIRSRQLHRGFAKMFRILGTNLDHGLVVAAGDIHRTRLKDFKNSIYGLADFQAKCRASGLTWRRMLAFIRAAKNTPH